MTIRSTIAQAIADPLMQALVDRYGPIAFGIVMLVVVWRIIVAPELAASRAALASLATAAESNKAAAATSLQAAEVSKATAVTLQGAAQTLKEARRA